MERTDQGEPSPVRIYGQYIDACNYERLVIERTSEQSVRIRSEAAGACAQRAVSVRGQGSEEALIIGRSVGGDWLIEIEAAK